MPNQTPFTTPPGMTRRRFGRLLGTLAALGCVEPHYVARAFARETPKRLSWLAYRNASREGSWALTDIEGEVPRDLNGTLYRIAPGQVSNHGTILNHLFDGDAFLSAYSFRNGKVQLRASYLATPERIEEQAAGKMLYSEFGTLAPPHGDQGPGLRSKNQPSVNVIHYDGRLLGLSEGGHPTAVDPETLAYQGRWDFHGTLPPFVPFTAHPKVDPATGEAYGFGVAQGPGMALTVFRMEPDGKLHQLHRVPMGGYFMIHDMLLTKEHFVFVIPPVRFDLPTLLSGRASPADALAFFENEPTKFLLLRRDGTGEPREFTQPANMVFHHGNAFEHDGKVTVDSLLSPNDDVLDLLYAFGKDTPLPESEGPRLTRLVLDLASGSIQREEIATDVEFPRFDIRQTGAECRHLFTMGNGDDDPLVADRLVRFDFQTGKRVEVAASPKQALGETLFVARKGSDASGWLLLQGFDAQRDENFLEVRDSDSLELAARLWAGAHLPLGFHGNFVDDVFVS